MSFQRDLYTIDSAVVILKRHQVNSDGAIFIHLTCKPDSAVILAYFPLVHRDLSILLQHAIDICYICLM